MTARCPDQAPAPPGRGRPRKAPTEPGRRLRRQEPGQPGRPPGRRAPTWPARRQERQGARPSQPLEWPAPRATRTKQVPRPQTQRLVRQGPGQPGRPPGRRAPTWPARRQERQGARPSQPLGWPAPRATRTKQVPRSQAQRLRRRGLIGRVDLRGGVHPCGRLADKSDRRRVGVILRSGRRRVKLGRRWCRDRRLNIYGHGGLIGRLDLWGSGCRRGRLAVRGGGGRWRVLGNFWADRPKGCVQLSVLGGVYRRGLVLVWGCRRRGGLGRREYRCGQVGVWGDVLPARLGRCPGRDVPAGPRAPTSSVRRPARAARPGRRLAWRGLGGQMTSGPRPNLVAART